MRAPTAGFPSSCCAPWQARRSPRWRASWPRLPYGAHRSSSTVLWSQPRRWLPTTRRPVLASGGWPGIDPPSRLTASRSRRLDLEPLLDLSMRLGEGGGALTALPVVQSAVATRLHGHLRRSPGHRRTGTHARRSMNLRRALRGPRTALSWLTILPVAEPPGPFDRALGGAVIRSTPLVGAVLGGIAAAAASDCRSPTYR